MSRLVLELSSNHIHKGWLSTGGHNVGKKCDSLVVCKAKLNLLLAVDQGSVSAHPIHAENSIELPIGNTTKSVSNVCPWITTRIAFTHAPVVRVALPGVVTTKSCPRSSTNTLILSMNENSWRITANWKKCQVTKRGILMMKCKYVADH